MRQAVIPSQYLQIALDLATRIAQGELAEGSRIYGRSVLASEYGVSPETIRKALRLLADMKVVDVKPQSGAVVLSADRFPAHYTFGSSPFKGYAVYWPAGYRAGYDAQAPLAGQAP